MKKIAIPEVAMGDEEVDVIEWKVKEGDSVKKGDALVQIESEKVNVDIESECDGVLAKIIQKEGDVVKVGQIIGEIEEA